MDLGPSIRRNIKKNEYKNVRHLHQMEKFWFDKQIPISYVSKYRISKINIILEKINK